ncbi:hypothetical protein GCM10011613_01050 [Cellvibrio zantedeschiae]|uniref:Uncharacterized protein n=1 Tax=Cellvibrio zantedeschiae TaxID=1237077 RepID=A0ABQ3AR56_9GAMM|nr:hypothetical protein [Cellvibrio zantedeschiae]GGY61445.1 hypothetical protein GCM10011613_01050 [Cellvibrio zantedeschiae]
MKSFQLIRTFLFSAFLLLWPSYATATESPLVTLPRLVSCSIDDVNNVHLSLDATGTPLTAGVSVYAGTRECDLSTSGPALKQPDGSWLFAWQDDLLNQAYRLKIMRTGSNYHVSVTPAACGALKLPAQAVLSPQAKGCKTAVDRHQAFVQFWRSLRDIIAKEDGTALEHLSLPQVEFVEGPDIIKAPASVMRDGARCLPDIGGDVNPITIRELLATTDTPRLDMPPLSNRSDEEVNLAGAMTAVWTPLGWRIQGLNSSPAVMGRCLEKE